MLKRTTGTTGTMIDAIVGTFLFFYGGRKMERDTKSHRKNPKRTFSLFSMNGKTDKVGIMIGKINGKVFLRPTGNE